MIFVKDKKADFKNEPDALFHDVSSLLKERVGIIREKPHSLLIITGDVTWVEALEKKIGFALHYNILPNTAASEKQIPILYPPGSTLPDMIIIEIQPGKADHTPLIQNRKSATADNTPLIQNRKSATADNTPLIQNRKSAPADHYELYTKLNNSEEYGIIPVIFVAEKATDREKSYGLSLGGLDFITSFKESDELRLKIINIFYYQSIFRNKNIRDLKTDLFRTIRKNSKREIEDQFKKYDISPKEKSVIRLLLEDLGYKEIAESLQISVSGVKKRINTICHKCGVKGKQELLVIFMNK
ncbi:MAG: helix-turn-helix transcriptional regulator [Spirochaetales bacterium]|nr:helix-turn-helix transcriptional regulator [Spirochaetales bacterium]